MEANVVIAEVIEATEPVRDIEAKELSPTAEKVAQAERCATNLGAVAIVCVGCPMLEMCRLRNEAMQLAQEQVVTVEVADEYNLTEDSIVQVQLTKTTEFEASPVHSDEVGIIAPSQPEKERAPQKPSYLERLLDDKVEVVLADSFMDAGEAPTRSDTSVRQSEEFQSAKETNGDVSGDNIKIILTPESLPIDDDKAVSGGAEVSVVEEAKVEEMTTVAINEPERSSVEISHSTGEEVPETIIVRSEEILVVSSDSEVLVASVNPVVEAVIDIVPTSIIPEVILTASSNDTIVTTTTITEATMQPLRFEPSRIREYSEAIPAPVEVRFEELETYIEADIPVVLKQRDELVTESIAAIAPIDTQPVEYEAEDEYLSAILAEQPRVVSEPEDTIKVRRYQAPEIDEVILPADVLASALIDSDDTIDPELRLSDTTAMHQLTIGVLRRLALQALRGLLREGRESLSSI